MENMVLAPSNVKLRTIDCGGHEVDFTIAGKRSDGL